MIFSCPKIFRFKSIICNCFNLILFKMTTTILVQNAATMCWARDPDGRGSADAVFKVLDQWGDSSEEVPPDYSTIRRTKKPAAPNAAQSSPALGTGSGEFTRPRCVLFVFRKLSITHIHTQKKYAVFFSMVVITVFCFCVAFVIIIIILYVLAHRRLPML